MSYKTLAKLYHTNKSSSRGPATIKELERRKSADSTFKINFEMPEGKPFIANPRELSVTYDQVLAAEREVAHLMTSLPNMACDAILRSLVLDEIVSSWAIEGINSTQYEVKQALDTPEGFIDRRRFGETLVIYRKIIKGDKILLDEPEDIRAVYDRVTHGEIDEGSLPDGKLFRARDVGIVADGIRILHLGFRPENKIIDGIRDMLAIHHRQDIPVLYRDLACHYLFECIHPFYDGNGRCGRALLACMLSEDLSPATALSLSCVMLDNQSTYYRAFSEAEDPLNHAELTFFVYTMLQFVQEAQQNLIEKLQGAHRLYRWLELQIEKVREDEGLKKKEQQIVFFLMQYELFDLFGEATLTDLADNLKIKEQMTRKHLLSLEEKGIVEKSKRRDPLTFALTNAFKQRYDVVADDRE